MTVLLAGAVAGAIGMVLLFGLLVHGPARGWALEPVLAVQPLRRVHLLAFAAVALYLTGLNVASGYIARTENRRQDREFTRALVMQRTEVKRDTVEAIARRGAIEILQSCYERKGCPKQLAHLVNRVLRVTPSGRIVAVKPGTPPAARNRVTTRDKVIVRERVVEHPPARTITVKGPKGDRGPAGRDGVTKTIVKHQLDSSAVDAVDNLVHDLEDTVGMLGGRVQSLEGRLGALLDRLCSLLRVCVQR
jgi:hypothetical protein